MNIIKKQTWISPKVKVNKSSLGGKGMFAISDIEKGEKIVVFGGDYTDEKGMKKAQKLGKLIMQWDDNLYSIEDRGEDNSYFINHSCNPNLWMEDAFTLVARRNIKPDAEVTADYALWEADESFVSSWKCVCGSSLCRGRVTGRDWQNKDLQKRYKGNFSPLINKRIANH